MIRILTCLIGLSLILGLAGCRERNTARGVPWEQYKAPDPPEFTPDEKGFLDLLSGVDSKFAEAVAEKFTPAAREALSDFGPTAASALKKVMRNKNAWRAIVLKHNEFARKFARERLKEQGYSDPQIAELVPDDQLPAKGGGAAAGERDAEPEKPD